MLVVVVVAVAEIVVVVVVMMTLSIEASLYMRSCGDVHDHTPPTKPLLSMNMNATCGSSASSKAHDIISIDSHCSIPRFQHGQDVSNRLHARSKLFRQFLWGLDLNHAVLVETQSADPHTRRSRVAPSAVGPSLECCNNALHLVPACTKVYVCV